MRSLRTGIIGIGGYGGHLLAELARNESFAIKAIADQNKELTHETARQYQAEPYDDYRSLIVQEKLDVLFLALPSFLCGDMIHLAAKSGINVFKETPLARTLPEAMRWVELMEKAGLRFQIGSQYRFAPGYLQAHQMLAAGRIDEVYLVRAECFVNFPPPDSNFGWRGDPVLAGGGVLLEQPYHLIDQITWNLGAPERLFSLNTDRCSKRVLPPSRSDDAAVLTMSFPKGTMGNLTCSWMTGPETRRLMYHGTEGSLEARPDLLRRYDLDGNIVKEFTYNIDEPWLIAQQLRHFADTLVDPDIKPVGLAREHLLNVATIESAYLSARTQLPETLKVYGSLFEL